MSVLWLISQLVLSKKGKVECETVDASHTQWSPSRLHRGRGGNGLNDGWWSGNNRRTITSCDMGLHCKNLCTALVSTECTSCMCTNGRFPFKRQHWLLVTLNCLYPSLHPVTAGTYSSPSWQKTHEKITDGWIISRSQSFSCCDDGKII